MWGHILVTTRQRVIIFEHKVALVRTLNKLKNNLSNLHMRLCGHVMCYLYQQSTYGRYTVVSYLYCVYCLITLISGNLNVLFSLLLQYMWIYLISRPYLWCNQHHNVTKCFSYLFYFSFWSLFCQRLHPHSQTIGN